MSIADLVHPIRGIVQPSRFVMRASLRRRALRRLPGDAELWRAVGIGFALAFVAGVMLALALGVGGPAVPLAHGDAAAAAMPVPGM